MSLIRSDSLADGSDTLSPGEFLWSGCAAVSWVVVAYILADVLLASVNPA
ncbi:hypothetical protein [Rhodoferax sp.]|nr:hypothetical protein [Rhodoferax sp.]MDD2927058.1 hypothetical protein [Rhodoferax sp.]